MDIESGRSAAAFGRPTAMDVELIDLGKLLAAAAAGALIGLERELHDKPAGFRTNIMICVGAGPVHVAVNRDGQRRADRGPHADRGADCDRRRLSGGWGHHPAPQPRRRAHNGRDYLGCGQCRDGVRGRASLGWG